MTTTEKKDHEKEKILQIRIDIGGKTKEMFEAFQDKYNTQRLTDTFRLIVKRAYDLDIKEHSTIE